MTIAYFVVFAAISEVLAPGIDEPDINLYEGLVSGASDLDGETLKRFSSRQLTVALSCNVTLKGIQSKLYKWQ